jgi:hypothetical protein
VLKLLHWHLVRLFSNLSRYLCLCILLKNVPVVIVCSIIININPRRAKRHIKQKQTDATQSDLVPTFLSHGLFYLHLSALSHRFFSMYLWVCLYFSVPVASISALVLVVFPFSSCVDVQSTFNVFL